MPRGDALPMERGCHRCKVRIRIGRLGHNYLEIDGRRNPCDGTYPRLGTRCVRPDADQVRPDTDA